MSAPALPPRDVELTLEQLDLARRALLARRDALSRLAAEHREGQSRVEAARAELERLREEDDGQIDEQRDFAQMLSSREQEEWAEVDAALLRLDEGAYGLCVSCGNAIAWPRLQAQPEAPRCIGCQSEQEAQARRRA